MLERNRTGVREGHQQRKQLELETELQDLVYAVSHDLPEPLRMISSYLQLLRRRYADQLDENANEFIDFAQDGAERMQSMLNDLLIYSRVTSMGKPFRQVDVDNLIDEVSNEIRLDTEDLSIEVTHNELPVVSADAQQLFRLFKLLLHNAYKFRDKEPCRVHVSAERAEGEWMFTLCDNGIGIPPNDRERVFEFFQRLHARDEYGGGTGMGLPICRHIIRRHGGNLWVDSASGEGSAFYFTLKTGGADDE